MFKRFWYLLVIVMMSGILNACGSAVTKPDQAEAVDSTSAGAVTESAPIISTPVVTAPPKKIVIVSDDGIEVVITQPDSSDDNVETIIHEGSADLLSNRTVYFDFDSSNLSDNDRRIIEAHARLLAENSDVSIVLQGHADERGSREYNIALGERRAGGIGQLMELLGVESRQLRIISYGEERPAVFGHNEASWAKNRRAKLAYQ